MINFQLLKSQLPKDWKAKAEEKNATTLLTIQNKNTSHPRLEGCGTIKAPPLSCFKVVNNIENANNWQGGGIVEMKKVESFADDTDLTYLSIKAPWPVSNRDFYCAWAHKTLPDGTYVQLMCSVVHRNCAERKGFVRGTIFSSGIMISPLQLPEYELPCSFISYIVEFDPAGM